MLELPPAAREVIARFVTTEYTTIDRRGQPVTWPVNPYEGPDGTVSVTTGFAFTKKAADAAANPRVALLFSDPEGSGLRDAPTVLVQGLAEVDDRSLRANRRRYERESRAKFPEAFSSGMLPPVPFKRLLGWVYLTRIYVDVRPRTVRVWQEGEPPSTYGPEPDDVTPPTAPDAGPGLEPVWDARLAELGTDYPTAVLAVVGADGFPLADRVPVSADPDTGLVRIGATELAGVPLRPGRACLTAHRHDSGFTFMESFQVRGRLVADAGGFALLPRMLKGGFELPPTSSLERQRRLMKTYVRYARAAARVLRDRARGERLGRR